MIARGWEKEGVEEALLNGYTVPVGEDENVLERTGGDSCITM